MKRVAGLLCLVTLVVGVAVTGSERSLAEPTAPESSAAVASTTAPVLAKHATLSPRLATLAAPEVQSRGAAGRAAAMGLPESGPGGLVRRPDGRVLVDVRVTDTSTATRAALEASGAEVTAVSEEGSLFTIAVAPDGLAALGSVPGVRYAREVLAPKSSATCPTGVVSEGDSQLGAAAARATLGVDGSGVTVGVLSDSFNHTGGASVDVATADLPGPGNPCGFVSPVALADDAQSGEDEGRAMAQIVHDLAPGASIAFASAYGGEAAFADNIRTLQGAGAKVIVDDVSYASEPLYQDGIIAAAINDVTAAGSSFFTAAGNGNQIIGGKEVGSYEAAAYRPTACPTSITGFGVVSCHDFDTGVGTDNGDTLTVQSGGKLQMSFGWNEPQFGVATDIDVFVVDGAGTVVAVSNADSPGSGEAFEFLSVENATASTQGYRVIIGKYSGVANPKVKFVLWTAEGLTAVQYNSSVGGDVVGPTLIGHSGALAAGSIGAIAYHATSAPETFSSRGPATYCWAPVNGTVAAPPVSPCQVKQLDVVATDGARNSFFGSSIAGAWRFYGTSAAAPHAAAVAALQYQVRPCRTPAEILAAQRSSGLPVGSFGVAAVGSGRLDAGGAVAALAACPATRLSVVAPTSATIGQPTTVTVTALDGANRTVPGYSGTVHLTSSDAAATLPPDAVLAGGTGTFPVTLTTPGSHAVIATDTASASVTGTSGSIRVAGPIGYHPVTPVRILESRPSFGALQYSTPWVGGADRPVHVTGGSVPANATAVVLNVTAVGPTAASDLRIYPTGQARPNASSLNVAAGQTIANLVMATVGAGGDIQIFNNAGQVDVVADLLGWYDDGSSVGADDGDRYLSMAPSRILESRPAFDARQYTTPWGAGTDRTVHVTGDGVPSDATAVVLNVTAVGASAPTDLRVYPSGEVRPNASNLNLGPGQTLPNLVVARVGTNGDVQIFNSSGAVDVVADVVGYFRPAAAGGDGYHAMSPTRLLESRPAFGALQYSTPWGAGTDRSVKVTGGTVPANATAVVLDVIAVGPRAPSHLRVYPTGQIRPNASNLNFATGQTVANLVVARVGANGSIQVFNNAGSVDVVADVVGFFT